VTRSELVSTSRRSQTKGTVLLSALALTAALLIIFLAVLSYCLSRYGQHVKANNRMTAGFLADAGVQTVFSRLESDSLTTADTVETAPNGGTIRIRTLAWGPYLLVVSEGQFANQRVRSSALFGSAPPPCFAGAITVTDPNYPMVVAGNTTINGDVFTGPLGMTTGRIRGEGVVNENFHTGQVVTALTPPSVTLDTTMLARYLAEQGKRRSATTIQLPGTQVWVSPPPEAAKGDYSCRIENNLRLENCRLEVGPHILSLFVSGSVQITGRSTITGLIEIVAGGSVSVSDSSVLDETLLYAGDSIVLTGRSQFCGVAVSSRRISVSDHAGMTYPGLLMVKPADPDCHDSCGIWLHSHGPLEGVCYLAASPSSRRSAGYQLFLDTAVSFTGILISEGISDLRGTLFGSVMTHRFLYTEPATEYINWVKDLKVDRTRFKVEPVPPPLSRSPSALPNAIVRQVTER
jgi:hypothetical protein